MRNNTAVEIYKDFKEIEIGVGVHDISNETYHESKGISRSMIMKFFKTPFHYYSEYLTQNNQKRAITNSLKIGAALHPFVLEQHDFMNRYQVVEKKDRRTKEGKIYYDLMELNKGDRELIDEAQFNVIKTMYDSLHSDKNIHDLISGAQYEKSLYWIDQDTGLLCKCRPDIWHDGFIVDLKTSADAGYREFQRSVYKYGYHIQCAMMYEAFKNIFNIEMTDFVFVVIENVEPYATAIYPLDKLSLEQSVKIFKQKLMEIKHCIDTKYWPSYKTQIITLPAYAIGE